jgi:cell division protein FtsB
MTTDVRPTPVEPKPRLPRRGLNIAPAQVIVVAGMVFGLTVIINFSSRIQAERKISAEADRLSAEVTALAATQQALATQLAYVQSDAYVAEWAHSEGRYVRPGEVLVVPVPASTPAPTPIPLPTVSPLPPSKLQIWWDLFFATQ